MKLSKRYADLFHSTPVMLTAILVVAIYLGGVIYWQSENFGVIDPMVEIKTLPSKDQRNCSLVTTGLHINSFPAFSFNKNVFTIDGVLWFKFPLGTEALETIKSFSIQNATALNGTSLLYTSEPIIKRIGNDVMVSYHIQTTIQTTLDYKNFPVSNYRLNIIMNNKNVSARELYFAASDEHLTINPHLPLYSWEPIGTTVRTGYMNASLMPGNSAMQLDYPVTVFSIDFSSIGFRDLISLYFPMIVLFLIALFCLLIDIKDTARLGYVGATVPILVLFRMVIDTFSPDTGMLTHVDFMYNLFVFLSLVILFFQTYVILRLQAIKEKSGELKDRFLQRLQKQNNAVFFIILLALVVGATATFYR